MRNVRRPLLVMHSDASLRDRVRRAGGREYQYEGITGWDDLQEVIEDSPPGAVVVVDPYAETNGDRQPSRRLRALLRDFPSSAVIAVLEVTPDRHGDLRTLGEWGVVQVISLGHDDTRAAIAHRLRSARGRPMKALIERVLPPDTPGRARTIMEAAADVVAVGGHGRDLARSLRLSRRTLLRWCLRAGLPPPRTLLAWMRVLQAAALLDDPGRKVLSVSMICGYSSDSGLRRITQKFLGASPTELRREGAFNRASEAFLKVFRETRKAEGRELMWQ